MLWTPRLIIILSFLIQWTPLIRFTLGSAQIEFYNRMNLIGEMGKE